MTDPILQNKERFDRKVEDIHNHPDLSAEAKRRYLSSAHSETKAAHDEMVAEHAGEQQRAIADLERSVFKINFPLSVSNHERETVRMSYRDAYNRAERVANSADKNSGSREGALKQLLECAERSGDSQQADAIYHLARERGMWGVADAYLAGRLEAKKRWDAYAAARQEAESLESDLFGRFVGPRKPHELGGGLSEAG